MVDFPCDSCGQLLRADERHRGRLVRCHCGRVGRVPPGPSGAPRQAPGPSSAEPPGTADTRGRRVKLRRCHILVLCSVSLIGGLGIGLVTGDLTSLRVGTDQPKAKTRLRPETGAEPRTPSTASLIAPRDSTVDGPPVDPVSLPTGTELGDGGQGGLGTLEVTNGTERDAVAALFIETGEARRAVYIRAGDRTEVTDVSPGTYVLRFCLGLDWNEDSRRFRYRPAYSEFVERLVFTEEPTGDGIRFSRMSVTLHPVKDGNARTTDASSVQFDLSHLSPVMRQQP